jgi:hypothetical protein
MRFGRNRRQAGRDVTGLLADFGHHLPTAPIPVTEAKQARLFRYAPRRGHRRAGRGWAAAKAAPVSTWRMTSDQAPVLWPFISTPGLPPTGAQIGIDMLSGGSFYADPLGWVLHDTVPVTNPNMFVFGKPGRGKSATVKALLLRMIDFGYHALILGDPKDESGGSGKSPTVLDRLMPAADEGDSCWRCRRMCAPCRARSAPSEEAASTQSLGSSAAGTVIGHLTGRVICEGPDILDERTAQNASQLTLSSLLSACGGSEVIQGASALRRVGQGRAVSSSCDRGDQGGYPGRCALVAGVDS